MEWGLRRIDQLSAEYQECLAEFRAALHAHYVEKADGSQQRLDKAEASIQKVTRTWRNEARAHKGWPPLP